jgi:hypothetical protein
MFVDLNCKTISSVAYKTYITDGGILVSLGVKENYHVKLQSSRKSSDIRDKIVTKNGEPRPSRRNKISSEQSKEVWSTHKEFSYTGNRYRRNRIHMDLRSRISRNSNGSLPKKINLVTTRDIINKDRSAIRDYTTASRGIRKCCLSAFSECSRMAISCLGALKDCSVSPYRCKKLSTSVLDLSKNTSAGIDTLGRKNDPLVQKRVLSQVRDIFRKPTSYKVLLKNPSFYVGSELYNMFNLPEVIFHRFQAVYDEHEGVSNEKSRIVWGSPYTIVALENVFFGNHISSCKNYAQTKTEIVYPIGLNNFLTGRRSVQTLRSKFKITGNDTHKIYSLDFSRFDATVPSWAKDLFFSTILGTLDLDVNQKKVYELLRIYTKNTPFIDESGIKFKSKGISSGMLITNLFDSWWNLTIFNFVTITMDLYPEVVTEILENGTTLDRLFLDVKKVQHKYIKNDPNVRIMGDDLLVLCDERTLNYHKEVCKILGMTVTIKNVTDNPNDPIFFLGRYWDKNGVPFQTEEYISLRICYTRWYDEENLPFGLEDLHLNRILSICLPLKNGKEFLDKYLFDYEPYKRFKESDKGFVYMKDFIEDTFQYFDKSKAMIVSNY